MPSLYKDLVRARIPTDHHESDLYVLDTPEARATINRYGYKFRTFTSNLDHKRWIDVPFAYEPFWEKKEQAKRVAVTPRKPAHARKGSAWPSVIGSHDLGTADVRSKDGAYLGPAVLGAGLEGKGGARIGTIAVPCAVSPKPRVNPPTSAHQPQPRSPQPYHVLHSRHAEPLETAKDVTAKKNQIRDCDAF